MKTEGTPSKLISGIATTRSERRAARSVAGAHGSAPVMVVPGDASPRIEGRSYYWTTACTAARRCRVEHRVVLHPHAYGWRCDYHHSTLRVVVGLAWLRESAPARIGLVADLSCFDPRAA